VCAHLPIQHDVFWGVPQGAGGCPITRRTSTGSTRTTGIRAADYKGRNVIERGFNVVKPRRGLAPRYDNLAIVYRGAAVLRTITIVARDSRFSDGGGYLLCPGAKLLTASPGLAKPSEMATSFTEPGNCARCLII
jgi:hypothetical protein